MGFTLSIFILVFSDNKNEFIFIIKYRPNGKINNPQKHDYV